MNRLDGKVAVISGGSRGMGAAHARLFVQEGAKVVIGDVLIDEGRELAAELGPDVTFVPLDVTREDQWRHSIESATSAYGPPNVLVNNAGIALHGPLDEMPEATFRRVMDINLVGVWLGMRAALPAMRAAGGGSIINISSLAGLVGSPNGTAYSASKFAVRGMTKSAALELAGDNIRVNSVHPGIIRTPILDEADPGIVEQARSTVPLQRIADAIEVSRMLVFLASDESSYSTGSEFVIDAGLTAM